MIPTESIAIIFNFAMIFFLLLMCMDGTMKKESTGVKVIAGIMLFCQCVTFYELIKVNL